MRNNHVTLIVLVAIIVVLVYTAFAESGSYTQPSVQRYLLRTGTKSYVFRIDTQTGQVWYARYGWNVGMSPWYRMGQPKVSK